MEKLAKTSNRQRREGKMKRKVGGLSQAQAERLASDLDSYDGQIQGGRLVEKR